jgi:hypothetical protein
VGWSTANRPLLAQAHIRRANSVPVVAKIAKPTGSKQRYGLLRHDLGFVVRKACDDIGCAADDIRSR